MTRSDPPFVKRKMTRADKPYAKVNAALPKRVEANARVHITYPEYVRLMETWKESSGHPGSGRILQLAKDLDRCRKQVNIWFSNRRQNIVKEENRLGRSLTDKETYDLLWSKYRETTAERIARHAAISSGSDASVSPPPSLSGGSSPNSSQRLSASPEVEPPILELGRPVTMCIPSRDSSIDPTAGISPMDALLEVANEELEIYEACEILLGLSCQCPQ